MDTSDTKSEPRVLMATTMQGTTVIVRRYCEEDRSFYEIEEVAGYLSLQPQALPSPDIPEQFASLEDVFTTASERWGLPREAFVDPQSGHRIDVDLDQALRDGCLGPLVPGMSRDDVLRHLGAPDAVSPLPEQRVCWFYGVVQLYFDVTGLLYLEVDRGDAAFTSLRFSNWFLRQNSTLSEVQEELTRRSIPYRIVPLAGQAAIETIGQSTNPRFTLDFDEAGILHALYWNAPRV